MNKINKTVKSSNYITSMAYFRLFSYVNKNRVLYNSKRNYGYLQHPLQNHKDTLTKETANIVVFCDGTFNWPTIGTNVYKLHALLLLYKANGIRGIHSDNFFEELYKQNLKYRQNCEIPQDAFRYEDNYYEPGVGGKVNAVDALIAFDVDEKIKYAYRHIVRRYNDNENKNKKKEIWLFGFSRGAYTVRCVAGMIRNCGILRYDSKELINRAYELYRSRNPNHSPKEQESKLFQKSFSHPIESTAIKFLGLWDTVGACGIPSLTIGKGLEYLRLHNNNISKIVKNVYQVLSIHEKSSFFEPISVNETKCGNCEECKKNEKCQKYAHIKRKEIWFPGEHLEVGGGIFSEDYDISNESLRWMIEKILCTGGLFSEERLKEKSFLENKIKECLNQIPKSKSLSQHVLSLLPAYAIKRATTFLPLMGRDRIIPLYKDDNGMLTFDLLHKKGHWESTKFKNIKNINITEHKRKKPDSLIKFYQVMEDILIGELKGTSSGSTSNATDDNGTKAKYQEQNIKNIKEIKEICDEIDKKDSDNEIDNDDKIDKEGIRKLFNEIGKEKIDNIESFDAKTISKFNIERLIHRYNVCKDKNCLMCF
ncbi:hypothetical protein Glove_219g27 [Diversispora epigaea]|uniref:T6SS Phospholipase effector Tle1-like catalytic domain-containing protein n=1 Tax=Diversispora epigaea TaxID=1348612 RepID=A0A397IKN9_9GLOM|nr:hypothetical protein Glove_219g27 [Diversispora epigaea]